jgi:hypothetical protein
VRHERLFWGQIRHEGSVGRSSPGLYDLGRFWPAFGQS